MNFLDIDCTELIPIIKLVRTILSLIQIGIPIILIVLGTLDLGKAVVASKDEEIKKAQTMLLKRFIYAVAIFFVVILVKFIFDTISTNGSDTENAANWFDCWDPAENN